MGLRGAVHLGPRTEGHVWGLKQTPGAPHSLTGGGARMAVPAQISLQTSLPSLPWSHPA